MQLTDSGTTVVAGNRPLLLCLAVGVLLAVALNIIEVIMVSDKDSYKADVAAGTAASGDSGAQASTSGDSAATMAALRQHNKVIIAVDTEWPPYCHSDNSDPDDWEKPRGVLLEVAQQACINQGLDCDFVYMQYTECWTEDHTVGPNLANGYYDMCLCWTPTYSRLRRTLWPQVEGQDGPLGFTMPPNGGFLVHSGRSITDNDERMRLRALFEDGCNGKTMKLHAASNTWYDCGGKTIADDADKATFDSTCTKNDETTPFTCPEGKIKVGIQQGWASSVESFDWIKNQFTGQVFDKSRLIFVNEHGDGDNKAAISTYNEIAKELINGNIDVGYVYSTVLNDMRNEECAICSDHAIWADGGLAFHSYNGVQQIGLEFAAGGPSGFFGRNSVPLRDAISAGAQKFIADKDKYCPVCRSYFKLSADCRNKCYGCDTAVDASTGKAWCDGGFSG